MRQGEFGVERDRGAVFGGGLVGLPWSASTLPRLLCGGKYLGSSAIAVLYSAAASSGFPWSARTIAEIVVRRGVFGVEGGSRCDIRRRPVGLSLVFEDNPRLLCGAAYLGSSWIAVRYSAAASSGLPWSLEDDAEPDMRKSGSGVELDRSRYSATAASRLPWSLRHFARAMWVNAYLGSSLSAVPVFGGGLVRLALVGKNGTEPAMGVGGFGVELDGVLVIVWRPRQAYPGHRRHFQGSNAGCGGGSRELLSDIRRSPLLCCCHDPFLAKLLWIVALALVRQCRTG